MTIAHQFRYEKPGSVNEAVDLLVRCANAQVLSGGTDLVGWIREDLLQPELLVDIKGIPGLRDIAFDGTTLAIGSQVTFNELIECGVVREHFPLIAEMAGRVASNGVRNRATMAGNICSAVPCNDSGPVLLVYEASIRVAGPQGERIIPLENWFSGPRATTLEKGEIALAIHVPRPAGNNAGCWVKMGRYKGEDLAQASVAVLALDQDRYRIAFGSVAPAPLRAHTIEQLLEGKTLTPDLLDEAKALLPAVIAPITDIRASKEYRAHMAGVMLERALSAAAQRLHGKGPRYGENLI
jgi:xanthine dehydrogenase FAD-binding subunit